MKRDTIANSGYAWFFVEKWRCFGLLRRRRHPIVRATVAVRA
ncbi:MULTISPECIES: hypothetical protein [unclassified Sinorhizobium]|nr:MULTISPECIES: hypothetical protein [unclassified Sinorhizobium]MDK1377470.1 hypothetical protein [Sinorhizobium sp. 6-70]MDK1477711.1 hypothetical protein [Sinorhizobium sp. 6-117]